jgi:hypothetical protein
MVCLRNILVDTLHKGDTEDNNNNNNNNNTSTKQSRFSETNRSSAGGEISLFYGNGRFITAFTIARPCSSSAVI